MNTPTPLSTPEQWAQAKTDLLVRKALLDLSAQFLALAAVVR